MLQWRDPAEAAALLPYPLTLSTMLQLLFNAADVVVVGRYAGDNSLAAVGSNTALINLLTNLFLGLSIGANILAARHYGAHEDEELSKTVHTSILLSIYSGLLLTVVGILRCPDDSGVDAVPRQCAGPGHHLPADLLRRS